MRTVQTMSAGGVVCRPAPADDNRKYEIVLVGQSRSRRWGLPKGAPGHGETIEQAALREVREETGLEARILAPLGHIDYWFGSRGIRYHKTVHFYLMQATGGDITQHDFEHDLVSWFPISEGSALISYNNEKEIVRRAEEVLNRSKPDL